MSKGIEGSGEKELTHESVRGELKEKYGDSVDVVDKAISDFNAFSTHYFVEADVSKKASETIYRMASVDVRDAIENWDIKTLTSTLQQIDKIIQTELITPQGEKAENSQKLLDKRDKMSKTIGDLISFVSV